jgi:hypothetical protein
LGEADCRGLNRDRCGGVNAKLRSSKEFPCHDSSQGFESDTAFGLLYYQRKTRRLKMPSRSLRRSKSRCQKAIADLNVDRNLRSRVECAAEERIMMERFFRLSDNQSNLRTEVLAGVTTFLTMAYIVFLQPAVLSGKMFGADTGMDFGAVTTATCLSAALATAIMALYARYPIAQAPGMGDNFSLFFRRFQRRQQPDLQTVGRSHSASCSCPACSS